MTLSRREFFGLGTLLVACGSRSTRRDAGTVTLSPTPHIADDDGPPPVCTTATAANIEGPYYKAGAPHRAVLADRNTPGERLVIAGTVIGIDCKPIANAELDIWHADARGGYDLDGYQFRGALKTDARGRYELHTIVPGRYLNGDTYRPAHVHVKLRAANHRTLTTQLYFPGDPYNEGDPFIVDSLIMQTRVVRGGRNATFDFVLG